VLFVVRLLGGSFCFDVEAFHIFTLIDFPDFQVPPKYIRPKLIARAFKNELKRKAINYLLYFGFSFDFSQDGKY
jgi:hypothetical protein